MGTLRIGHRMLLGWGRVLMGHYSHYTNRIGHAMLLDGGRVLMGHVVPLCPSYGVMFNFFTYF